MSSELESLRQRVAELEAENMKLKQFIEESAKREAESVNLKAELEKNKIDTANFVVENAELRDRVTKLEQKQTQVGMGIDYRKSDILKSILIIDFETKNRLIGYDGKVIDFNK